MSDKLNVLVVDDEAMSTRVTVQQLRQAGYLAEAADSGQDALARLELEPFDVVLSDLRMPQMDGQELLRRIKEAQPDTIVILMSAYGDVTTAVEAMRAGASDFLIKPFPFEALTVRLEQLSELCDARREIRSLRAIIDDEVTPTSCGLQGRSTRMTEVKDQIMTYASSDVPVLISGETGTGKELVARALHLCGPRRLGAFIAVACGAIPRELAESELFGHQQGAFSGATTSRRGFFERANGGTLLLDNVDDLPLDIQIKLLRVLQEGAIVRVGDDIETRVNVRLVATTRLDMAAGPPDRMRDDLFFRLRGLEINLPPLRERGEDILLLATHFLGAIGAAQGARSKRLTAEASKVLGKYSWPGNIRELHRAMESAVLLSPEPLIRANHLPDFLRRDQAEAQQQVFSLDLDGVARVNYREVLASFEAAMLRWALRRAGGNQQEASEILGIPRTTLQNKFRRITGS